MRGLLRIAFAFALWLCTAAGAVAETVPRSLSEVESAAEDAIDFADAGKLERAAAKATYLEGEWKAYRKHAVRDGTPAKFFEPMDHAVRDLMTPATLHDPLALQLAANEVSRHLPELFAPYAPAAPVELLQLDYLGRAIMLDARQRLFEQAAEHFGEMQQAWIGSLEPKARKKNGGESVAALYNTEMARLRAALDDKDANAIAKSAARSLEIVDGLERLFPESVTVPKR